MCTTVQYQGKQIEEDEIGGMCSTHENKKPQTFSQKILRHVNLEA